VAGVDDGDARECRLATESAGADAGAGVAASLLMRMRHYVETRTGHVAIPFGDNSKN
jgi:hypothetical protein